jgi:hypothetical protein
MFKCVNFNEITRHQLPLIGSWGNLWEMGILAYISVIMNRNISENKIIIGTFIIPASFFTRWCIVQERVKTILEPLVIWRTAC